MAAAARIVLGIGNHHRAGGGGGDSHGLAHRIGRWHDAAHELRFSRIDLGQKGVGRCLRILAISRDGLGTAGEIGIGKAEAIGQFGRGLAQPRPGFHHPGHRLHQRALAGERHQKIHLPKRLGPARLAAHQAQQQPHRLGAGIAHIHMRIGAKRHQRIAQRHHLRRHIGMRVEARGDGRIGADHGAHPAQQFALGIREIITDHGAMQVEIDAIQRASLQRMREFGQHNAGDPLKRLPRHRPGRIGEAPHQGHDPSTRRLGHRNGAARGHRERAQRVGHRRGVLQVGKAARLEKLPPAGGPGGEGMAFMQKAANGYAHLRYPHSPWRSPHRPKPAIPPLPIRAKCSQPHDGSTRHGRG